MLIVNAEVWWKAKAPRTQDHPSMNTLFLNTCMAKAGEPVSIRVSVLTPFTSNMARREHCFSVFSLWVTWFMVMPRCTCASEVYGSVFVFVSVCRLLQVLQDQWSASKRFYTLLVIFNLWICFVLELWNAIVAVSEQFEAKLVHVLLLYLAVSSVLER